MATDVLSFLRAFEVPLTVREALHYLVKLDDTFGKLYLYQKLFPEHYAASAAVTLPRDWEAFSEKEIEFFRLVDQKMFPVPWEHYEDEELHEGNRDNSIWVQSLGPEWWDCGPQDLVEGWQILLVLTSTVALVDTDLSDEITEELKERRSGDLSWPKLTWLCQSVPPPLNALPQALEMLDRSTGNVWLDYTDDSPYEGAVWCEEDVLELAKQYRDATNLIDRVMELFDWMHASSENLREVVKLWNGAVER